MVYKWYILPIGGLYATYHLLGEPETTIDYQPEQAALAKVVNQEKKGANVRGRFTYIHPFPLVNLWPFFIFHV